MDFTELLVAMAERFYKSNDAERYEGAALIPMLIPDKEGKVEIHVVAAKDLNRSFAGSHPDGGYPSVRYSPKAS